MVRAGVLGFSMAMVALAAPAQRVGCVREDDGMLEWIDGPPNGQVRRIEFRYRRASCESR